MLQEHGKIVEVGNTEVYVVGSGAKCVIWCHDMKGFNSGDRTRQLIDKLSELTGWVIVLPNFLGDKKVVIIIPLKTYISQKIPPQKRKNHGYSFLSTDTMLSDLSSFIFTQVEQNMKKLHFCLVMIAILPVHSCS